MVAPLLSHQQELVFLLFHILTSIWPFSCVCNGVSVKSSFAFPWGHTLCSIFLCASLPSVSGDDSIRIFGCLCVWYWDWIQGVYHLSHSPAMAHCLTSRFSSYCWVLVLCTFWVTIFYQMCLLQRLPPRASLSGSLLLNDQLGSDSVGKLKCMLLGWPLWTAYLRA
jgi:hypothetical protein